MLIGPPGTGKTVALEDLRAEFLSQAGRVFFDTESWDYAWNEIDVGDRQALNCRFSSFLRVRGFRSGPFAFYGREWIQTDRTTRTAGLTSALGHGVRRNAEPC